MSIWQLIIIILVIFIWVSFGLLAWKMAKKRNRGAIRWTVFGLWAWPFAHLFLWSLWNTKNTDGSLYIPTGREKVIATVIGCVVFIVLLGLLASKLIPNLANYNY